MLDSVERERFRDEVKTNLMVVLDAEWRARLAKAAGFASSALMRESDFTGMFGEEWDAWVAVALERRDVPPPPEPEPVWTFDRRQWPKKD